MLPGWLVVSPIGIQLKTVGGSFPPAAFMVLSGTMRVSQQGAQEVSYFSKAHELKGLIPLLGSVRNSKMKDLVGGL